MPYRWDTDADGTRRLLLWRHRSLEPSGFAWVMGLAAAALGLPLLAVVGSPILWGLLPFAVGALWGLWHALQYAWRRGGTVEELDLTPDLIRITRRDPGRRVRHWQGNPYWVRLTLHDRPVEHYLTLTDGGREVELGAFLTPAERLALHADLAEALDRIRAARPV